MKRKIVQSLFVAIRKLFIFEISSIFETKMGFFYIKYNNIYFIKKLTGNVKKANKNTFVFYFKPFAGFEITQKIIYNHLLCYYNII